MTPFEWFIVIAAAAAVGTSASGGDGLLLLLGGGLALLLAIPLGWSAFAHTFGINIEEHCDFPQDEDYEADIGLRDRYFKIDDSLSECIEKAGRLELVRFPRADHEPFIAYITVEKKDDLPYWYDHKLDDLSPRLLEFKKPSAIDCWRGYRLWRVFQTEKGGNHLRFTSRCFTHSDYAKWCTTETPDVQWLQPGDPLYAR